MATPYMNLTLPTPTVTPGPLYATENNTAFTSVDSHDHTPGAGKTLRTSSINFDQDVPFNGLNAINLRSTQYQNQAAPLALAGDITCIYASGGNLYWNNASGQQVQITAGAALNASSIGAIGGDYATSTASVFYTSLSTTFTFWSAANISALMDQGATTIRATGASAKGVTLTAPAGLGSNYALTFPTGLPAAIKIATIDNTGAIGAAYDVDNSTLQISSNTLSVKAAGITDVQLAANSVGNTQIQASAVHTTNILDNNVTFAKLAQPAVDFVNRFARPLGTGVGSVTGSSPISFSGTIGTSFTGALGAMSLTTQGGAVSILYTSAGASSLPHISHSIAATLTIAIFRDSTELASWNFPPGTSPSINATFFQTIQTIDFPAAGTYTYSIKMKASTSGSGTVGGIAGYAFEI